MAYPRTRSGVKKHGNLDHAPGPGAYSSELSPPMNYNRKPPAYSIKSRDLTKILDERPGPNSYLLLTCIGLKVPDKRAQGAFSITGHHEIRNHRFRTSRI